MAARFVDGPRQLNGIAAGLVKMPFGRFVGCDAAGATVWALLFSGLGYFGGTHLDTLYDSVLRHRVSILAVLGVLVAGLVVRWALRRARAEAAGLRCVRAEDAAHRRLRSMTVIGDPPDQASPTGTPPGPAPGIVATPTEPYSPVTMLSEW